MPITKRQTELLNRLIEEYVETAKPVSSELLKKKCKLEVCPATVRNEMQDLTKKGYLKQPHTSAGRVPTNKAYRHFVKDLINEEEDFFLKDLQILKRETKDIFRLAELTTKLLSSLSSGIALTYLSERDLLWEDGWKDVFSYPEFEDRKFRNDFIKAVERMESKIKDLEGPNVQVYIGREGSFLESSEMSLIASKRSKAVMAVLGPNRMTYKKNIKVVLSLTKILEDF